MNESKDQKLNRRLQALTDKIMHLEDLVTTLTIEQLRIWNKEKAEQHETKTRELAITRQQLQTTAEQLRKAQN